MDRVAVFVDAGYLLTAGALAVSGAVVRRQDVLLDAPAAMGLCRALAAAAAPHVQLLRIYWYDAAVRSELTAEHRGVAREPGCRLRLGSVSAAGVQKGVDTAIVRDLGTLARHRAVSDAVLLTGDEDLHTGLDEAQEWGVRVHLAAVQRDRILAAVALQWDADSVIPITPDQLAVCIRVRASARPGGDAEFLGGLGAVDDRRFMGASEAVRVSDLGPAPTMSEPAEFEPSPPPAERAATAEPVASIDPPGAANGETSTPPVPGPPGEPEPEPGLAPEGRRGAPTGGAPSAPSAPLGAELAERLRSWAGRGGADSAPHPAKAGASSRGTGVWSGDLDAATREEVEAVAHDFVAQLDGGVVRELHATIQPWGGIPPEWDRALILQAASTLEQPVLQEQVKRLLRQALYEAVHARVAVRRG